MIQISLLGHGTVGSGVYELINKQKNKMESQYGTLISFSKILVSDLDKHKASPASNYMTTDFNALLSHKPHIVIEAMGGVEPAYTYVKTCLENGIHVITANKDLIAEKGDALRALALKNNLHLFYEASVAGGIPILKPIRECMSGNEITQIQGILNGTTNYILTQMYRLNQSFDEALKDAQSLGYAESNPTSDVDGLDAARKLSILANEAFGATLDWKDIPVLGIRSVQASDILYAKEKQYKIRLMAYATSDGKEVHCHVRPAFVGENTLMSQIELVNNGVLIEGDAVGQLSFIGRGAGSLPTASAILSDLSHILMNWNRAASPLQQAIKPLDDVNHTFNPQNPASCPWVIVIKTNESSQSKFIKNKISDLVRVVSPQSIEVTHPQHDDSIYLQTESMNEASACTLLKNLETANFSVERVYPVYVA